MASWNEISDEIREARDGYEQVRHKYLKKFHELRGGRNVISYASGWLHNGSNREGTSIEDKDKTAFMSLSIGKRKPEDSPTGKAREGVVHEKGLDLILHTGGGNIAAAESIMDFLLDLYHGDVEVFVPQVALSAGTIMACGAKKIHMGTYSSLGPIDPHIGSTPVWSILEDFKEAKRDIAINESNYLVWLPILQKYSVGIVSECNVLNQLSASVAKKWLNRESGMFGDLKSIDREKKASEIVRELSNYSKFKSHDRHISMNECKNEIGFGDNVVNLAGDGTNDYDFMKSALLSYHHTCEHTFLDNEGLGKIIENHLGHTIYSFRHKHEATSAVAEIANLKNFRAFLNREFDELIDE